IIQSDIELESSSGIRPGFGQCSESSPRVRLELAEDDQELARCTPGVRRKMIERLVRNFAGSSEDQLICLTRTIVIVFLEVVPSVPTIVPPVPKFFGIS
ncbi:hypothetical protein BHM03_00046535, partial [Ensete ventricosum]